MQCRASGLEWRCLCCVALDRKGHGVNQCVLLSVDGKDAMVVGSPGQQVPSTDP